MNFIKNLFKNKPTRIWLIVTVAVIVLIIAVDITLSILSSTLDIIWEGARPIVGKRELNLTETEALEIGHETSEKITEEGFILFKNEGALPLDTDQKNISVFGKNSVDLVYGASGSGGKNTYEGVKTIYDSLTAAGYSYNTVLKEFYEDTSDPPIGSGPKRPDNAGIETKAVPSINTGETPLSAYSETVKESYASYKDAALIVLSRIGGEGWDLPRANGQVNANTPGDHYLQLDKNEKDLIKAVCNENFEKIIIVLNSNTPIELGFLDDPGHYAYDSRINGCIWIGTPGDTGIMSLGKILKGDISPSGRTVDTYARNFSASPVWVNFGDMGKQNGQKYLSGTNEIGILYTFVDYEEDIYVGYRYYETRGYEEAKKGNADWYGDNVVYPFGYGMSYASFDQEFSAKPSSLTITDGSEIAVSVKVTNNSTTFTKEAKDAVQIYVTSPYGGAGKLEKSYVALAAFGKSEAIEKDASDEVDIKIDPYLFASYDEKTDGGCFVLEAGDYIFRLGKNAHEFYTDTFTMNVPTTVKFKHGVNSDVKNRFSDASDPTQLGSKLVRSNFEGTMPVARTDNEKQMSKEMQAKFDDVTSTNPIVKSPPEYPDTNVESNLKLLDMRKVPYNNAQWDKFIKMLTISEMTKLATDGQFKTESVVRGDVIVPATICSDGPFGFVNFMKEGGHANKVYYPSEVVIAATWNKDIAEKFGESVGKEALIGNGVIPISGWYAPGANIHRSPFGGRVSEYFSEDPLLSGKMAAGVVTGAREQGVMTFVKHFAVNEQETSRQGIATWLSEQTLREIYLRPFEIAVKEGKSLAMMSSFNRIGSKWTGGDYRLLTEVLRGEWGFEGMVVCDYFVDVTFANPKQMIYAGGDLHLISSTSSPRWFKPSNSSAADITILQTACKNILYSVANSNIIDVEIEGYLMSIWSILVIVINAVVIAGLIAWGVFVIMRMVKKNKKASD